MINEKKQDILDWKVEELKFEPINQDIQYNRINNIRVSVYDDAEKVPSFKINQSERNILNSLNFNIFRQEINLKLNHNIFEDDIKPITQYIFKPESISDQNSFLYKLRTSFLNSKHQIKIDDVGANDIELGENDVWAM